jgi:hypothetical protein
MKFVLMILLLLSLSGFAQEETRILTEEDIQEMFEAEQQRQKSEETAASALQAHIETEKKSPFNMAEELNKLGYKKIDYGALMDERVVEILRRGFKESGLSKLSDDEVKNMLSDKARGSFMENIYAQYPVLLNISADIMRSEDAMPAVIGIFKRKEDFKQYLLILILLWIAGFSLKRILIHPDWGFLRKNFFGLMVSLGVMCSSMTIFYKVFHKELQPTVLIFLRHL